jgi:Outer membrane protein beta-barrel domain
MKRLFALLLYCAPLLVSAQLEKGNVLLTGGAQFWNNTYKYDFSVTDQVNKNADVSVYTGFLVSPRIAIGLNLNGEFSRSENNRTNGKSNKYGAGPFIRYYHPITEKFYFVAQGSATFATRKATFFDPDRMPASNTDEFKETSLSFRPGLSFMITDHWLVELYIGYLNFRNEEPKDDSNGDKSSQFTGSFGISSVVPSLTFVF